MTQKAKYEKPKLLKLGYDEEAAVGSCAVGNGVQPTCNPNGNKADSCATGGSFTLCAAGGSPVS